MANISLKAVSLSSSNELPQSFQLWYSIAIESTGSPLLPPNTKPLPLVPIAKGALLIQYIVLAYVSPQSILT